MPHGTSGRGAAKGPTPGQQFQARQREEAGETTLQAHAVQILEDPPNRGCLKLCHGVPTIQYAFLGSTDYLILHLF